MFSNYSIVSCEKAWKLTDLENNCDMCEDNIEYPIKLGRSFHEESSIPLNPSNILMLHYNSKPNSISQEFKGEIKMNDMKAQIHIQNSSSKNTQSEDNNEQEGTINGSQMVFEGDLTISKVNDGDEKTCTPNNDGEDHQGGFGSTTPFCVLMFDQESQSWILEKISHSVHHLMRCEDHDDHDDNRSRGLNRSGIHTTGKKKKKKRRDNEDDNDNDELKEQSSSINKRRRRRKRRKE